MYGLLQSLLALTTCDDSSPHHILDLHQAVLGCTTTDGEHIGEYWYIRRYTIDTTDCRTCWTTAPLLGCQIK